MGQGCTAICKDCGNEFTANIGGGFFFHLLHCHRCGKEKFVGFDELGEIHLRYIKGLSGPYCMASASMDENIQNNYQGKPLSEKEYHTEVEKYAGNCECGGKFKFNAKPRCPACKSQNYDAIDHVLYD